jgi:hypothetical protein
VSSQVDLECDDLLGRDFLQQIQAQICYKARTLTFQYQESVVERKLISKLEKVRQLEKKNRTIRTITLPKRSEVIVKLPVTAGATGSEGLIKKKWPMKECTWRAHWLK